MVGEILGRTSIGRHRGKLIQSVFKDPAFWCLGQFSIPIVDRIPCSDTERVSGEARELAAIDAVGDLEWASCLTEGQKDVWDELEGRGHSSRPISYFPRRCRLNPGEPQ
jgi:hypothetical protein